jgi:hypothetical protein
VPVFITNCHVSENLKIGPEIPQISIIKIAIKKADGVPVALVTKLENLLKKIENRLLVFFIIFLFTAQITPLIHLQWSSG